jgi:hypothetical protein
MAHTFIDKHKERGGNAGNLSGLHSSIQDETTHPYAHLNFPPVDFHPMYLTYPKRNSVNIIANLKNIGGKKRERR